MALVQNEQVASISNSLTLHNVLLLKESRNKLNYSFVGGQQYLIQGQNGAGKTTLLQGLSGMSMVADGHVSVNGCMLTRRNWRGTQLWNKQAIEQLQYVPQHIEELWFCGTIKQELQLIMKQYERENRENRNRMQELELMLKKFGFDNNMIEQELQALSLGQQKRLALAIGFCLGDHWLLLDEPLAGLDQEARQLVLKQLMIRKKAGRGTIIVSHQITELMRCIDTHLLLDHNGLQEQLQPIGNMEELLFQQLLNNANNAKDAKGADADAKDAKDAKDAEEAEDVEEAAIQVSEANGMNRYSDRSTGQIVDVTGLALDLHQRDIHISRLPYLFDPRVLILSILLSSISLMLWNSWLGILLYGLLGIVIAIMLRKEIIGKLGILIGFGIMSGLLVIVGGLSFTTFEFDIPLALLIAQRMLSLLVIILLGLPLLSLMTPFRLQRALQQSLAPFQKLSISLNSYALLVSLIFRLVPLLSRRWQELRDLSRIRFNQSSVLRWRMLAPLMLAYVRGLLRLAEQLATSLELRGFDLANKKPLLHARVQWQRRDTWLLSVMLTLVIVNVAIHQLL